MEEVNGSEKWKLIVNCENMAFCSLFAEALQEKLNGL
jgi:hypothetical protein